MDINTPKGQESLSQEQEMLSIISKLHPNISIAQTPKLEPSDIDGVVLKGGDIVAIFESKCRNMTTNELAEFKNEWLVTFEKLQKGANVAKSLCVPFVGYLYLVPESKVLSVRIADKFGNFIPKIRIERTETQETVNGGKKVRTNAYIDVTDAKVLA